MHKTLQLHRLEEANFKTKESIFGPKFKKFCFYKKLCYWTNLRTLILNKKKTFSNFSPENSQLRLFWYFRHFCFCKKYCHLRKNWVPWFQICSFRKSFYVVLQYLRNCSPKHPNKIFFVPNLRIYIFPSNFVITKMWEHWCQIWQ